MRKSINYINNKTLYTNMIEHRSKLSTAERENKPKPQVSDYIGKSILQICNNLARKGNFSGYSYKSDMISDGILDCIAAVDNFDPDRTNNPFAYFTQIAWNAFLRRIEKEKKQTYIKHKNFQNQYTLEDWDLEQNNTVGTNEHSDEIIRSFETKSLTLNKKKPIIKGIEKFTEEKESVNEE